MKITRQNGLFTVSYQGVKTANPSLAIAIEAAVSIAAKRAAFRSYINSLTTEA